MVAINPSKARPFIRYPGGKTKLKDAILTELCRYSGAVQEYREPFLGGGSIAIEFLKQWNGSRVSLNDADPGMAAIWMAVVDEPGRLQRQVSLTDPSVERFDSYKNALEYGVKDRLKLAAMKLMVHQCSFSGLGEMGGPMGGRHQLNYSITDRWNAQTLCFRIASCNALFNRFETSVTCEDFSHLLTGDDTALVYLDPPYFEKGGQCYKHSFSEEDHIRLAAALRDTHHMWVLTGSTTSSVSSTFWKKQRTLAWSLLSTMPIKTAIFPASFPSF